MPTVRPLTAPIAPKGKQVCEVLVRAGLLKPEQADAVLSHAERGGDRVEEAVLDLGLVAEAEMLKALSAQYQCYFATTEKLSKAEVARALLSMLPQRFAEQVGVCPVMFDPKAHTLSVVTADPDNVEALRDVQLASGAREVKPILARPAAVKALIAKAYAGDSRAFAVLDASAHLQFQMLDVGARPRERAPAETKSVRPPAPPTPAPKPAPPPPPPPPAAREEGTQGPSFVELLNVLVSLLESSRVDLRGHSSQVARLAKRMAETMRLDAATTAAVVVAAYVHDLGKTGQYHLTALNCSEYEGHKVAAQKTCNVPSRLLAPVRLPRDAVQAAEHMYERYDGKGFPDGTSGKDIPLGARLLAICDTYADLTQNPRNPFRKALTAQEACAALAKYKDTIFDPNLVDLFRNTVLGEDLKARLLADRSQALLVDVDPEETTVLELRMVEQGFVVKTARSAEQALKILAEGETDLVVSEVDLGPRDGLQLLGEARAQPWGKDVPWVVYTRRQERAVAQKAFDLGVVDFVNKPANADVLVAKLKAQLDQRASPRLARGVSGSLREMGLPDMVQVLFHGRKSGNLKIRAREGAGEIHFVDGSVVDALWGELRGEDAFYAMLRLQDGEFGLDPTFKAPNRVIHASSEALLLEGMRRLDEGI